MFSVSWSASSESSPLWQMLGSPGLLSLGCLFPECWIPGRENLSHETCKEAAERFPDLAAEGSACTTRQQNNVRIFSDVITPSRPFPVFVLCCEELIAEAYSLFTPTCLPEVISVVTHFCSDFSLLSVPGTVDNSRDSSVFAAFELMWNWVIVPGYDQPERFPTWDATPIESRRNLFLPQCCFFSNSKISVENWEMKQFS